MESRNLPLIEKTVVRGTEEGIFLPQVNERMTGGAGEVFDQVQSRRLLNRSQPILGEDPRGLLGGFRDNGGKGVDKPLRCIDSLGFD